ncbi:FtsB family cell division protein [Eubacterium oxidoreducens]|uniref:Cell division protein DivIC n=1 Tax=Eubacterium oxidoreducens TaxID=1732 RepID=A0A1G6BWQ1_EUBOX|nr:septum formation initiator family protein [Eubacterium oxidoreducens]SDB25024.1 cell division protein DivIC [Eubacterium oxidoreducens]
MARRRGKRKKKNTGKVCVIAIVCMLVGVMSVRIVALYQDKTRYEAKASELQSQIEDEEQRAEELDDYADYVKTAEYIEKMARAKLGLVYDNEIVFKEQE